MAVNITLVPAHTDVELAALLTDGVTCGVTDIVILFDIAVLIEVHPALLVNSQVIISPFASELFV